MIIVFSRREVFLTDSTDRLAETCQILEEAGIRYVRRSAGAMRSVGRNRSDVVPGRAEPATLYALYVMRSDAERAMGLLGTAPLC